MAAAIGSTPRPKDLNRDIAKRWTERLSKSWTPVSDYFLENYYRLQPKLSSLEAMFIIHLIRHKWDERHPFPSFNILAKRMGVTPTAVRNHARNLEKNQYLKRIKSEGQANRFDLNPLFAALERMYLTDFGDTDKGSKEADRQVPATVKPRRKVRIVSPPPPAEANQAAESERVK